MSRAGRILIGISGWRYKGWRGSFYPEDLPHRRELEFAAQHFDTIELNGSFYSLQRPQNYKQWHDETPDDFTFAVKGSRYITHMLKLNNAEAPLSNFIAQGLLRLGKKLGPILWQFPPQFAFNPEKLQNFFDLLPRTQSEAARLARRHDQRLKGRSWLQIEADIPIRHAIEIRHASCECPEFIAILRKSRIALVVADTVEWPLLMDVTADFVYCRLHGSEQLYTSGYEADAIDTWARRVVLWSRGEEVTDGKKAHPRPAPKRRALAMCTFTSTTMLRCGRPSMLRPCVSAFCSSCQRMKEIPKEWYPPLHQPKRRNGQSSDDRRLMRVVGRKL